MVPVAVSSSAITPASGKAAATAGATEEARASCTCPAPTRRPASPASATPPAVRAAPPITTTRPRAFFELSGPGSGQLLSSSGVTSSGSGTALAPVLRHVESRLTQVGDVVVHGRRPGLVVHPDQPAHGRVAQRRVPRQVEDLVLLQALARVTQQRDHDVVAHDQHPCTREPAVEIRQPGPQPEHDVGPRLATGRAVVELPLPSPTRRLLRVPRLDPGEREPVEHAKLAVPQALVDAGRQLESRRVTREASGLPCP